MILFSCCIDLSIPGQVPTTVNGVAKDFLDAVNKPNGKILNGLDLPMWMDFPHAEQKSFATDVIAWNYACGQANCSRTTPYPTEHVRWGLAGTANAATFLHIDSDGFATDIQVMCGKKVWGIYRESPEHPLSSTDIFVDAQKFELASIPKGAPFGLEAIVLRPGDRL